MELTETVTVIHRMRLPQEAPTTGTRVGIGHFFEATAVASGTDAVRLPTRPYTLTVGYTDAEKGPAVENSLRLYRWDGGGWVQEPTAEVDVETNTVTATPDRLGLWAVLGETHRVFLPLIRSSRMDTQ